MWHSLTHGVALFVVTRDTPMPTHPREVPDRFDEQLAVLADSERRTIVTYLRNKGSATATLDELAAVLEPDSSRERDYVRIRLHHTHLPKLATTPLITYHPEMASVEYHGHPEFEALLDILPTPDHGPPHIDP